MKITDEKRDVVKVLMKANIQKNTAKTMLFLHQVREATSNDIQKGADLKQPEASVALSDLRKRNLVSAREVKKEGKGRPVNTYRLTRPLNDIIEEIQKEMMSEFEKVKKIL